MSPATDADRDRESSQPDENSPRWRLDVRPAPTDEEAAALVVALLAISVDHNPAVPVATDDKPSRWAMAGRYAARSGIGGGSPLGWGRTAERR